MSVLFLSVLSKVCLVCCVLGDALPIFVSLPTAMLFVMLLSLRFGHLLSVFLLNFLLTNLKALVFCFTPCSVQLLQQALTYRGQHEMSKAQFNFFFSVILNMSSLGHWF